MRKSRVLPLLATAALAAGTVFAQDVAPVVKPVRFAPMVRVMDLESGTVLVMSEGKEPTEAVTYRAYPYGSTFDVAAGIVCKFYFTDASYISVRGPARFRAEQADEWRQVILTVDYGDINIYVERSVEGNQFVVKTPLGTFERIVGLCRLHLEAVSADGSIAPGGLVFRAQSGSAVCTAPGVTTQPMANGSAFSIEGSPNDFCLVGVSSEVKADIQAGGDTVTPFSLTPGARIRVKREKPAGSDNHAISVLTLYANGQAQNYFCFVENRTGDLYVTGDILEKMLASANPEEDEKENEEEAKTASEQEALDDAMNEFGDSLGEDLIEDLESIDFEEGAFLE